MEVSTGDPEALRGLLRGDRRVAFVEPVLTRHLSAEFAEAVDPDTGRPFDWAYDAVEGRRRHRRDGRWVERGRGGAGQRR